MAWAAKASLPLGRLGDPDTVRAVLNACVRRLDGRPAAATTIRRKRAVFANCARQPHKPDPAARNAD